jgi:hypothetical protein
MAGRSRRYSIAGFYGSAPPRRPPRRPITRFSAPLLCGQEKPPHLPENYPPNVAFLQLVLRETP